MAFRLIPIFLVAAVILMFVVSAFDDRSNASDTSIVDGALTEVDGVLDNALDEDSFEWLSESLSGVVDTVESGVESVTD